MRHFPKALLATLTLFGLAQPGRAQAIDTATAIGALRDFDEVCRRDAGHTWGRSLCGPVALVEPSSRLVIANDTVGGRHFVHLAGAFITALPAGIGLANTSFTWGGRPWAMVILQGLPDNRFARLSLLAHESFHREQEALGLSGTDAMNTHLDEEEGRRLLRLELRALAAALTDSVPTRRADVENALVFRAHRRALFPGSEVAEMRLELQEGLAEYTGARLALLLMPDSMSRVVRAIRDVETRPTLIRSFAYGTGLALGLLLDRFAGDSWRDSLRAASPSHRDLGRLLALASGARFPSASRLAGESSARAARYDGAAVAREERLRAVERSRRTAAYRSKFVSGPVLILRQDALSRSFNPNELFAFGDQGTVYPTGTLVAPWGTLTVTDGALVSADFRTIRVAAPASDAALDGPGWSLQLAEGWKVRRSAERSGDFEVTRATPP